MTTFTINESKPIGKKMNGPEDLIPYLQDLKNADQEAFYAVSLDAPHKILSVDLIALGGHDYCSVDLNILFRRLLANNAAAFVIAHNHPSGNPEISKEDIEITKKIKEGSKLLNLRLLDHLIFAGDQVIHIPIPEIPTYKSN